MQNYPSISLYLPPVPFEVSRVLINMKHLTTLPAGIFDGLEALDTL